MKSRGIKDLYLPQELAFHVKLLLFCASFSIIWSYFTNAGFGITSIIGLCSIMIFDLEIAHYILKWLKKLSKKYASIYNERSSIKKVVWFNLLGLLSFYIFFIALNTVGVILYLIAIHWINGWEMPNVIRIVSENDVVKVAAIAMLFSIPIFLFQKWMEAMNKTYKLREQNLIFQNETLKSQVNPHFLFNSLNTLSSLVNSEVEIAEQFIARLSVIYRYILDNSSKLKVPLKEEIDFIKDYYYLHQIRSEGKIFLDIEIAEQDILYEILPVSLQLLIENAIKHNMATQEKPLRINIYIEEQNIIVKNNIQKMATQVVSTNIGLKNLNERVKLLTGKEIDVMEFEGNYFVKVPLIA